MSKITYLENLYKKSVNLLTSNENQWKDLLSTVGRFYKRSFDNAVLIHVQNPDSTQLATFDEWHSDGINRSINKGVKGLAVIDMSNPSASIKHYFDLMDTNGSATSFRKVVSYMWELENQYKPSLMVKLHEKYGTTTESISDCLYEIIERSVIQNLSQYIDDYEIKDESSVLYGMPRDVVRQEFLELIARSTYYVVMSRCGMSANDVSFEHIGHFNTLPLFVSLGSCITKIARPILKEIDQEIKIIKSERSKIYEQRTQTQRTSDSSDLHRGQGRTTVSEPPNLRERADRGSGQIRETVERLDEREPSRATIGIGNDRANQSSDNQGGQSSRGTQGATHSEPTTNATNAPNSRYTYERSPYEHDLPHSRGSDYQRGIVPSTINDDMPSVVSDKKLATDGFFVVPKSKRELEVQAKEEIIIPPIGTFFDYLNSIFMYVGTDESDNSRHLIRSLEEKNVTLSYTDEGFYEYLASGEVEIVTDPAISNVFGFQAQEEVYIWNTKYKIVDYDCDEVVFQSVANTDDVRTETLLNALSYLSNQRNLSVEEPRDTRFDLDEEEISDLIDVFLVATDVDESTLEYQSEIHDFFCQPNHKKSTKAQVVKSYYGTLDTSYVTQFGDYLEEVKSDEYGIHFKRDGQSFYVSYVDVADRIDRLILTGAFPFSEENDSINDYDIPDEVHEMQGVTEDEETDNGLRYSVELTSDAWELP